MSRFKKTMLLAALTALLLCLSGWLQADIGLTDPAPFLRALTWLPGVGVALLGTGIFLRRGRTALFFDAVGGVTLAAGLVLFVLYGGMDNVTAPGADTAINLVLCLWTALPLCFTVYTMVLGFGTRDDSRVRRRLAAAVAAGLALWLLGMLVSGQMLQLVRLKQQPVGGEDIAFIGTGE